MHLLWKLLVLVSVLDFGTCRNLLKLNETSVQYQTKSLKQIKIRLKIHYDPILSKKLNISGKHNNDKTNLKYLTETILQETENILNHESLNQKFDLELIESRTLKNSRRVAAMMNENVSKYLKSYCLWQSKKKTDEVYYSVLFTSVDFYYLNKSGKKVRRSTGRGYMGGMCMGKSSCTLIKWNKDNAGYLLAHEIGHSLGMSHDGVKNKCSPKGFIMEEQYNKQKPSTAWSSCSRESMNNYLSSRKAWCLRSNSSNRR